jgi:hypothetical protein
MNRGIGIVCSGLGRVICGVCVVIAVVVCDDLEKLKRGCELVSKYAPNGTIHDWTYFGSESAEPG